MATAILIVSDEGGREAVATIAANKAAARKVIGIAKKAKGSRFVPIESMAATGLLAEAFGTIEADWKKNPGFS